MIEENLMKTSILFDKSRDIVNKIKPNINTTLTPLENMLFLYNEKKVLNIKALNNFNNFCYFYNKIFVLFALKTAYE